MIEINGIKIGEKHSPYIIAELSANHGGSINVAKESIRLAKESGASAVYNNEKLGHLLNHCDAKPIQDLTKSMKALECLM